MNPTPIDKARAGLASIVQAAERGESTTITKRGRPVAEVVPIGTMAVAYEPGFPRAAPSFLGIPLTFRDLPAGVQAVMLDGSGSVVAECRAGVWTTAPKGGTDAE